MRRDPAGSSMEPLTGCQANRIRVCVRIVRGDPGPDMKSLTHCQVRVGVRIVRSKPAGPGMKSLTPCQANRTRVGMKTVRRDPAPAGPDMKSLTSCQASRTKVGVTAVRRDLVMDLA